MAASTAKQSVWYKCADGMIVTPMDVLQMIFFPHHYDRIGDNVCYEPRPYEWPLLKSLLPEENAFGGTFLPDDFIDGVVGLSLACLTVTLMMIVAKHVWEWVDPTFNNITPPHKKWYVVANISKSFFLLCIAVSPRFWIASYQGFLLDNWPCLLFVKRCCILYLTTDVVALYMVPKLPTSTIIHHITTTVLVLTVSASNIKTQGSVGFLGACKMCVLYGSFSSIPYLVNAYLGLRVVYSKKWWMYELCRLSLITYLICCCLNWLTHLLWLLGYWGKTEVSIPIILYLVMMMSMVNDDIVLIRWLFNRSSPMASVGDEGKKEK